MVAEWAAATKLHLSCTPVAGKRATANTVRAAFHLWGMPHFAPDCAYFFVDEYFHDDSFRKCFEHPPATPLLPRQPCHEVRIQWLPGKFRLPCLVPLRLHGMQRSLQCNRRVLHAHGNAWSHVCCRRAWRKHREVPYTRSLVVPQPEYRCQTGCTLVLWRRRLRLWLRCQHQGRLGQDLVKAFVHKMRV